MGISGAGKIRPTKISMNVLIVNLLAMASGTADAASLFLPSNVPATITEQDPNSVELGVRFKSSVAGQITGIRFYKGPQNTGTHTGHVWSAAGQLLASATFANETASGWQQVNLAAPLAVAANTTYVVSYHSNGYYSESDNYFTTALTNGPLTAPASSSGSPNGMYGYGKTALFPTNTYKAANYWVDVVFATTTSTPTNSPPVANNVSGLVTMANTPLTIPAATLLAKASDPNGQAISVSSVSNPKNGTVSFDGASTIKFTPTTSYTGPASFTFTIADTAGGTASATASLTVNGQLAAAFYVSPTGKDSNNGTSTATPFLTLERAQTAMESSSTKTTYLLGGVHKRTGPLMLNRSSDAGQSWLAYPGQTPIVDGGNTATYVAQIWAVNNITFRWITFRNFTKSGFEVTNTSGTVIDSNTFYNINSKASPYAAVTFFKGVSNSSITHNLIYNMTGPGLAIQPGMSSEPNNNNVVDSNIIHDVNTGSGDDSGAIIVADLPHISKGTVISNNQISNYGHLNQHVGIYLDGQFSNASITHNMVTGKGSYALQIHGGNNLNVTNNLFDITSATAGLGLYQDMVGSGGPNYGMNGNVFKNNIISVQCNASARRLWSYINQSGGQIALPSNNANTYYKVPASMVTAPPIVDSAPIYQNVCYSLPTGSAWSAAGPLPR